MKVLVVIQIFAVVSIYEVWGCSTDTDCPGGCCYSPGFGTATCHKFSNISEPCHLPDHTINVVLYPCGCAPGLTCDEIHFDPTYPDPIHQAELLLLGHGYGICTDTPGTVFG